MIDAIDLPAIIRQSSGSLASETVRTYVSSIEADRAVERVIDRSGHRRIRPDSQLPGSAST